MNEISAKLTNGENFSPSVWLSEEILWGIVEEPFPERWEGWLSDDPKTHESARVMSNWDIARLHVEQVEAGSKAAGINAAWRLGRIAAGLCSYAVQFRTRPEDWDKPPEAFVPEIALTVQKVIEATELKPRFKVTSDQDAIMVENNLKEITELAKTKIKEAPSYKEHVFLLMNMAGLAIHTAAATTVEWLGFIKDHGSSLEIVPGGTPLALTPTIEEKLKTFRAISRMWQN
jgi:hypothetical protein